MTSHDPPDGTDTASHPLSDTAKAPSLSPWNDSDWTVTDDRVGLLMLMTADCRPASTMVGENSIPAGTNATVSIGSDE